MDGCQRPLEQVGSFRKDHFEADWIKVAEGRFSQVYEVKSKRWREKCALKCLDPSGSADSYRRVAAAAAGAAGARFRHVAAVYGLCEEARALVLEYMSGGSLSGLLASHSLTWPKKLQMIHEASVGVSYLHGMTPPLLHLNLKTSNLLLDEHLHVKISDFCMVHWEEGMSVRSLVEGLTARGNASYIPPEAFTPCPEPPGAAFDVYSFAIVMWEIMSQQKPHAGCSVPAVLLQASSGKRPSVGMIPEPRPSECDPSIRLMQRCWDQDPRKRPLFPDIVGKTEALSEVLKIPGPIQSHRNVSGEQNPSSSRPDSPGHDIALPEKPDLPSDDQHGQNGLLALLSTKDFSSFRRSVKGEHVLAQFSEEKSLLHYTVASGDAGSVEHVLSLGAHVNCSTAGGYTPLIVAVLKRLHEIAALLLERGADPDRGDEDQWTALHFAAQGGDDRSVRLLLDRGAAADARERSGWTALHLACQNGHEAAVRLLLSRLPADAAGAREREHGRTPLHLACAYGHLGIAKLLLSKGADPGAADSSLATALHLSAEEGHNRLVRLLVKTGVNVDGADSGGFTPLHRAALRGHAGICRQLLANGADPNARTLQDWTPVHLAAARGHGAALVQLADQGGCVNAAGRDGWTPLHLACRQREPGAAAALLAARADADARERAGRTPLHVACAAGAVPGVLRLIAHGADVNAAAAGGATPLHEAARHGCEPAAEALLLNGADAALLDSSGASALSVASRCEKWEIVQLLEKEQQTHQ